MLPSRGLRPTQLAPLASRQMVLVRSHASRKFSSVPRSNALSTLPNRASSLQSSKWRTGTTSSPNTVLSASTVRYGSWYAPWTWGRSSTPQPPQDAVNPDFVAESQPTPVTTATPELAPASIDKAAVFETASSQENRAIHQFLDNKPEPDAAPLAELDPTRPIDHLGQLKELGLDYGWGTSAMFENIIERLYLFSGLEWAGCVLAAATILRLGLFPVQVFSSHRMAKMAALRPLLKPLQDKMEIAVQERDQEKANMYRRQQQQIMGNSAKDMVPMGLLMVTQIAVGFGAFRCLRGMSSLPVPGMTEQSFLWITDLTVSDPYYLLPMIAGSTMILVMKKGGESGVSNTPTSNAKTVQTVMAGLFTLITAFQPAVLQLYFCASSALGFVTSSLLRHPGARRFLRIRPIPSLESNELFSKISQGEVKFKDVRGPDGKIRYQAPTITTSKRVSSKQDPSAPILNRGIKIKAGTVIPAHLRKAAPQIDKEFPDRDVDFAEGMPEGSLGDKIDWIKRNYKAKYVWRRIAAKLERKSGGVSLQETKKDRAKRAAEQYEIERRKRFENRR